LKATLLRNFKSLESLYIINDLLHIEIASDLIKHSKDYNEIVKSNHILFSLNPVNLNKSAELQSISKPFSYLIETKDSCSENSNITCLESRFNQTDFINYTDTQIISTTDLFTELIMKSPSFNPDFQIRALSLASNVILKISERSLSEESKNVCQSLILTIDMALNQPLDVLDKSEVSSKSSTKFATSAENILKKLKLDADQTIFESESSNMKYKTTKYVPGLSNDNSALGIYQNYTSGAFNQTLIDSYFKVNGNLPKLSYIIYKNSKFFSSALADNSELLDCSVRRKITNKVISMSSIPGLKAENLLQTQFEVQPIETNCSLEKNIKRTIKYDCVFWEEEKRAWNNYGCTYSKKVTNGFTSHFCNCNHTTNFAMLMVKSFS